MIYKFTDEHRRNLSIARRKSKKMRDIFDSEEYKNKMRLAKTGNKNGNFKGIGKLTSYDTYYERLSYCEEIKRDIKNPNLINVKCLYCGGWFIPSRVQTENRLIALSTVKQGEQRFYCNKECKRLCPTYRQYRYPLNYKKKRSLEVSPDLRKIVFERDNWVCQKCESKESLECHHIDPISKEPLFANDSDSCITLCDECHKEVHMKDEECKYATLRNC